MSLFLFPVHKLSKQILSKGVMEIYSPVSKDKSLFKKNRFKNEPAEEETLENNVEPRPIIIMAEVSRKQGSIFSKAGKAITEKLKTVFEFSETV